MGVLDFIAWVEWWLAGGEWTTAASRWRSSPGFVVAPGGN